MTLKSGLKLKGFSLALCLLSACTQVPGNKASLRPYPITPVKDNSGKTAPETTAPEVPTETPIPSPSITPSPSLWPSDPWESPSTPWFPAKPRTQKPTPSPSVKPSTKPSTRPSTTWPTIIPGSILEFFTRPFEQAFGVYDRGSLKRPDKLANSGDGILKVFQARNRAYGTLDITTLMASAAKEVHREIPATESVQVGDISDADGGRLGGHGSHQNGLDADIIFLRRNHRMMDPVSQKANVTGFDEDFVDKNGKVTENFDLEANWKLIQILVSTGRVDRIFIDKSIKKVFCENARDRGMREEWGETLGKLRHWPNHQDHLHLRIICPEKSKDCKAFAPVPAGDGCDRLMDKDESRAGGFLRTIDLPEDTEEHGC